MISVAAQEENLSEEVKLLCHAGTQPAAHAPRFGLELARDDRRYTLFTF
jgi:hypothetical protein